MCVGKNRSNEVFVYCSDVFLGVAEGSICKCSEDIHAFLALVFMRSVCCLNANPLLESHSKDGSCVLKVCGSGLRFCVLCVYGDVVDI